MTDKQHETSAATSGQAPEVVSAWEKQYTVAEHYDEMIGEGGVREQWRVFLDSLNRYSANDLQKIRTDAQRYLRENGVIYRAQEEVSNSKNNKAHANTWALDPLPLIYTAPEWANVEAGMTQRARLFQAILRDIYGEQRLITQGILPSAVIYAHSGYLRPAVRALAQAPILPLFASDFTRTADGKIWILSDATQAPPGAGHTLENRLLLARLWPDAFQTLNILRIADFFKTLKNTLNTLSPRAIESPCIVVLTAGPNANTYFEQAYLASYLGYHLVQSNDLTVQDGQVWLKSLAGLQRVDVILRYIEDFNCDPLELNPDPAMGVPGLLQAVRKNNVVIANPLGAGILENPGLYPFLPKICEYLLGEALKLSTVDTWWCGQQAERQHVINNIDSLIIKSIDKHRKTVDGAALPEDQKQALIAEINQAPYRFVGQQKLSFSSAPTLTEDKIAPIPIHQKVFAAASSAEHFMMLPGGIANTIPNINGEAVGAEKNKKTEPSK